MSMVHREDITLEMSPMADGRGVTKRMTKGGIINEPKIDG